MKHRKHINPPADNTLAKQRQRQRDADKGLVRMDRRVDCGFVDYARFVFDILQRPDDEYRRRLIRQLEILMDSMGIELPQKTSQDSELEAMVKAATSNSQSVKRLLSELSLLKASNNCDRS